MKKLLLLFVLLTSCAPAVPMEAPTPEPTPTIEFWSCEYYFNTWEAVKENQGALGAFFVLPDGDYLIFAKGEAVALHEVVHIANLERGYPSQTPEFEAAVVAYLDRCTEEQICWRVGYYYDQGQLDEVYAELYMWSVLYTIPQEFKVFYAR